MYLMPTVEVEIRKDNFSIYTYDIPLHEVPATLNHWGPESLTIGEKGVSEPFEIESYEREIERLWHKYGEPQLRATYGAQYQEVLSKAMKEHSEKERVIDGSENTAQPKNGTSPETRV